jgi:threonine/homoserine/homoserine lactone efflux protein
MDSLLAAYVTFTFILVVTPGSTTAVVVRNTLIGGRTSGLAAACGAAVANSAYATAAGLGLAVVFARWPLALSGVRVAGAAYLGWLGLNNLWRVLRHAENPPITTTPGLSKNRQHRGSFRHGLTANLLNPAIALFYLVVVPSFISAGAPRVRFALLAAIHVAMALICHSAWAIAFDTVRQLFKPPGARRLLETATGVALIALALRVLLR